jgi:hypothetical protein
MSKRITWWPLSHVSGMRAGTIVLMRYDWPEPVAERIYQIGIYDNTKFGTWHDGCGNILQAPNYFTAMNDDVLRWLKIPPEQEYTYSPARKVEK